MIKPVSIELQSLAEPLDSVASKFARRSLSQAYTHTHTKYVTMIASVPISSALQID